MSQRAKGAFGMRKAEKLRRGGKVSETGQTDRSIRIQDTQRERCERSIGVLEQNKKKKVLTNERCGRRGRNGGLGLMMSMGWERKCRRTILISHVL